MIGARRIAAGLASGLVLWAAAAPAAPASGGAIDRGYVIGRWTDNGDCADAVAIRPDGVFRASNGNEGLWHLADDRLTLQGESTLTLRIVPVDRDTMDVINPDDSRGRSTRCPGGEDDGGDAPAPALDRAYVIGRWTDDQDCSNAVDFVEDGRFVASNGNEGLWLLVGDRLTMRGGSSLTLRIVPVDRDTMTVVNPDGALGRSTRC